MHTHAQTSTCGKRKKCPSQSVPIPIFTGLDIKPRWSNLLPSGGLFLIWCKERDSLLLWWTRWKDELPGATSCNRHSPVEKVGLRMKERKLEAWLCWSHRAGVPRSRHSWYWLSSCLSPVWVQESLSFLAWANLSGTFSYWKQESCLNKHTNI